MANSDAGRPFLGRDATDWTRDTGHSATNPEYHRRVSLIDPDPSVITVCFPDVPVEPQG